MKRKPQTHHTVLAVTAMCVLFPAAAVIAAPPQVTPSPSQSNSASPSASSPAPASPTPSASISPDADFVQAAVQTEVGLYGLASLGQKKASDSKLKQLAKDLQKSTDEAYRFLDSYAKKHSIASQKKSELRAASQYSDLLTLSGKDFDRQFGKALYIDANIDVDNFSQQAEHGKDAALRAFAKKQVAELQRLAKATTQYKGA